MSEASGNRGPIDYLIVRSCMGFTCWVNGKPCSPAFSSREAAAGWAKRNAKHMLQRATSARVSTYD